MLEPLLRANLPALQELYDRFPSPARNLLDKRSRLVPDADSLLRETRAILRELRGHESWTSKEIAVHQASCSSRPWPVHAAQFPSMPTIPQAKFAAPPTCESCRYLDRETVRQNQERLLSRITPPRQRIRAGTTGTTGANLHVAYTEELARENWAHLLRQWAWAGIEPRHPRITLFGARIVPTKSVEPPYWTYNFPERQILMSIFHLSEKTAPDYLDFLERRKGKVLEGFPSVLGILADFVLRRGKPLPMRVIFTSGEPLYPSARAKIEKAFQARIFDSYGMTEYCGLIQECEGGQMHLIPEYGFLEILDEQDRPVQKGKRAILFGPAS